MAPYLEDAQHILYFGCGDSWYLEFYARRSQKKRNFYGYDFSKNMVEEARARTSGLANVTVTNESLNYESLSFDSVYSFAVLAHILDEADIKSLFSRIYASLPLGGRLIIFEQTGPKERRWSNGVRRTKDKYLKIAQSNGFILEALKHVRFPIQKAI